MAIPPVVVNASKNFWNWEWNQLMNGLAPSDSEGNYRRPPSQHKKAIALSKDLLSQRSIEQLPRLIIGRSCPWAHRTWLVYEIRKLHKSLVLVTAKVDHNGGRWRLDPPLLGCNSLLDLYQKCGEPPNHRATVPVIIDPGSSKLNRPLLLGNESTQLIEVLNEWPSDSSEINLEPKELGLSIKKWAELIGPLLNDGVYRCGFARSQIAYETACNKVFETLATIEEELSNKGPWLCGEKLTLADIRLFPTLIRWEMVYMPLFGCSKEPLWTFPNIWEWRKKLMNIPNISKTCDPNAWRKDYFGALFPLNPSNIVPLGPNLEKIVNANVPKWI